MIQSRTGICTVGRAVTESKAETLVVNLYETHLTLGCSEQPIMDNIRGWAQMQGLKWTQIVLDSGRTPLQPMITFRWQGTLEAQHRRAIDVVSEVEARGGSVVRIKIEAALENSEVQQAGQPGFEECYFEQHVKVRLEAETQIAALQKCVAGRGARVSQNSRRKSGDGAVERFVTQRAYHMTRNEADERLQILLKALNQSAFQVVEVESEYVVFDSNIAADFGWLEPPGESKT